MKIRSLTLIELLVGIAVAAGISGATLVSFTLVDRRRLEIEGRNLAADMQWTRQMAVNRRENYFVVFNLTADSYTLYNQTIDANHLIKSITLQSDLASVCFPRVDTSTTFTEMPLTPPEIRFSPPQGAITRSNGNPISNIGAGSGNPMHVVMIKVTRAGREAGIMLFAETGFASFKPEYDPSKKTCFIATAAYSDRATADSADDKLPQEVRILQEFRDRYLAGSLMGQVFIELYYSMSPPVARYIGPRPWARRITRFMLQPAVWFARQCIRQNS